MSANHCALLIYLMIYWRYQSVIFGQNNFRLSVCMVSFGVFWYQRSINLLSAVGRSWMRPFSIFSPCPAICYYPFPKQDHIGYFFQIILSLMYIITNTTLYIYIYIIYFTFNNQTTAWQVVDVIAALKCLNIDHFWPRYKMLVMTMVIFLCIFIGQNEWLMSACLFIY